jgi:hypothetical protein
MTVEPWKPKPTPPPYQIERDGHRPWPTVRYIDPPPPPPESPFINDATNRFP